MKHVANQRILQIMPADGWWGIYADDVGGIFRQRIVAFALVLQWYAARFEDAPEPGVETDRLVVPLDSEDFSVLEAGDSPTNYLGLAHADEWTDELQAGFKVRAERYRERLTQ